jgi:hypothetical protein
MRMVLTTQRKSELLNSDQSLKIFARVIIVGESSSSIIHEEKKNTFESLLSLSSHLSSSFLSTKDICYDVTIIVRPQEYNHFIVKNNNKRSKRKRFSTNSGGSSGVGESSDEAISSTLAVPATSTTYYAHRSILSVSLEILTEGRVRWFMFLGS